MKMRAPKTKRLNRIFKKIEKYFEILMPQILKVQVDNQKLGIKMYHNHKLDLNVPTISSLIALVAEETHLEAVRDCQVPGEKPIKNINI